MSTAAPWLDSDRELLLTVRRIHELFAPEECREWLLGQLHEYVLQRDRGKKAELEWESQRRVYFETEVFKPGMSKLRNRMIVPSEKMVWATHSRYLERGEEDSVTAKLKRSSFTTFELRNGEEVSRRVACFERAGGRDWVYVQAWTPLELETLDKRLKCCLPLPPEDIGRPYSDAEICMGLAILHDSAGTFTSLIPVDGDLGTQLETECFWETALANGIDGYPKTGAKVSWPLRIEPLINRIELLLPKGKALLEQETKIRSVVDGALPHLGSAPDAIVLVTVQEIADLAGVTAKTVRNNLSEARTNGDQVPEAIHKWLGTSCAKFNYSELRPLLIQLFPKRTRCFPESLAEVESKLAKFR